MKKLVSILLVAVFAMAIMATGALAADATLNISSASAKAGETVNITVNISGNPGFTAGMITIDYDSSALELTGITNNMFNGAALASTGKVNHASISPVDGDGTLATFTFKVKEDAIAKDYTISCVAGDHSTYLVSGSRFEPTVNAGTITVQAEATHKHEWGGWQDCKDGETHIRYCKDFESCGGSETADHKWDDGVETTAATHTKEGVMTYTCTECGATKTGTIAKLEGHTYGNWKNYNDDQHVKECACGDEVYENHNWDGKVTKQATHTEEGEMTYTCTECGATKTGTIAKLEGHTYGNWKNYNDDQHVKECTCGEKVYENHNWVIVESKARAVSETEYKCTECGATKTETDGEDPDPEDPDSNDKPDPSTKPSDKPTSDKSHKTGEDFIALWTILFVVAGAAVVIVTHKKKEN